jgi:Spy/CpxP family protein refolding chaperone
MEAKTKRNLIIWGIVFLVLLNVSSLGTIWYHRYQFRHNKMSMSLKDRMPDKRTNRTIRHRSGSPAMLTRELDLSDKQQQKFDSIWRYYNDLRQEIEKEMEANRREMGIIMSKADVDTSSFYAMSGLQSKLMLSLDHSMVNMNLALRATLNNEQMMSFLKRIEMMNKRKLKGRPGETHKRKRTK